MRVVFVLGVMALTLGGCATPALTPTIRPTRTPLPADLAVQFFLETIQTDGPAGHMIGSPTVLRGELTTPDDAFRQLNGQPPDPQIAGRQEKRVWLIVTRGKWLLHIMGAQGDPLNRTPTIKSKDMVVEDVWQGTILDAVTGEMLESGGIRTTQIPQLETLPALHVPADATPVP